MREQESPTTYETTRNSSRYSGRTLISRAVCRTVGSVVDSVRSILTPNPFQEKTKRRVDQYVAINPPLQSC